MIRQKCKICGKEFEARQKNYTLCSDKCKKINKKQLSKAHYIANRERKLQHDKERYHKKVVGFPCKFCGKEVKPIITDRLHRYHWHEECLIDKCIEAIKSGEPFNKKTEISQFAYNKGFTKAEILEIMKERGETV